MPVAIVDANSISTLFDANTGAVLSDENTVSAVFDAFGTVADVEGAGAGVALGTSSVSGVVATIAAGYGTAAGVATVTGIGTAIDGGSGEGFGSVAGIAVVSGTGASVSQGFGTAASAASVTGEAASASDGLGSIAGVATVTGQANTTDAGQGTAVGAAAVTGLAAAVAAGQGTIAGLAAVGGEASGTSQGLGTATGSASVSGTARALVDSDFAMLPPIEYDPQYYWAPAAGRLSNYQGSRLLMGTTDYVWWTIDGNGADPGLAASELSGRTGHVVDVSDGDTAASVATDTVTVISAIAGWELTTSTSGTVNFNGPAAVTLSGDDWDDRGNDPIATDERNGLLGSDVHRYASGSGMVDGALNTGSGGICTSQHMTVPSGGTRRVYALQIYIGTGWSSTAAERAHWALYSGTSSTTPITGSALVYDFGQELTTFSASGWHTLWVDADTLVEIDVADELWLTVYGAGTTTTHGIANNSGAADIGDWSTQALVQSSSTMPTDATTAAPSAHAGTTTTGYAGAFMARLICEIAPYAGQGQFGSASDPIVFGHHNTFTDAELTADAVLTQTGTMPNVGPSVPEGMDYFFGATHASGNQPRTYVYEGADVTDPIQPDIEGASFVRDFGNTTGTDTNQFVRTTGGTAATVANQAVLTWGATHDNPATIRYILGQSSVELNCDTIDAPMDWGPVDSVPSPSGEGPEVALIADGSSGFDVDDPTASLPTTIGSHTPLLFDNIGGIRGLFSCAGLVAA